MIVDGTEIKARENIKKGYEMSFCLKCELTKESGGEFVKSGPINVQGEPDCSAAMKPIKSQQSVFKLEYDEKGTIKQV